MDDAILSGIRMQELAGLDFVSDGEWRRESYVNELFLEYWFVWKLALFAVIKGLIPNVIRLWFFMYTKKNKSIDWDLLVQTM